MFGIAGAALSPELIIIMIAMSEYKDHVHASER